MDGIAMIRLAIDAPGRDKAADLAGAWFRRSIGRA